MNKHDYWDEKDFEKYQKMKVGMDYNDLDFTRVKKFSRFTNLVIKAISIPTVIIGILAFLVIVSYLLSYWTNLKEIIDPDVIENLSQIYDEEFVIMLKEENEEGEEIYKLSPKSNKDIIFNVYKESSRYSSDFQDQAYKYFVEKVLDENIRNKLIINESFIKPNENLDVDLLRYSTYMQLENFEQIEEYSELMKQIRNKAVKLKKKVYSFITTTSFIQIGNYHSNVQYSSEEDIDILKKQEKYQYINYLKEAGLSTENIPDEELQKYKPRYCNITINGKSLKEEYANSDEFMSVFQETLCARYNEGIEEYEINLKGMLEYLDNVEVKKIFTGEIDSFTYKGKEYKLQYQSNEIKNGKFPYMCRISYLQEYFGATIEYKDSMIYINI